jgi:hypothetical protein
MDVSIQPRSVEFYQRPMREPTVDNTGGRNVGGKGNSGSELEEYVQSKAGQMTGFFVLAFKTSSVRLSFWLQGLMTHFTYQFGAPLHSAK